MDDKTLLLTQFQCRERLMGDCYQFLTMLLAGAEYPMEFQCRERLMGDCYWYWRGTKRTWWRGFQCRERLMGDCYLSTRFSGSTNDGG